MVVWKKLWTGNNNAVSLRGWPVPICGWKLLLHVFFLSLDFTRGLDLSRLDGDGFGSGRTGRVRRQHAQLSFVT
jgi:hypothetical protein